jgi:hypothetical protein
MAKGTLKLLRLFSATLDDKGDEMDFCGNDSDATIPNDDRDDIGSVQVAREDISLV